MSIENTLFLSIIVIIIVFTLRQIFKQAVCYNLVPRKIWTYWDNLNNFDNPDKLPKAVQLCMESWRRFNPEYEIVLLTKKNFQGYVTIPEDILKHPHFNDSSARFSDLVRLYALEEHGGIWIDASVLVKKPFNEWLFPKYGEFSGYYMGSYTIDEKKPVIESWFLAANKNSEFIKLWKKEFLEIANYKDIHKYLESRKQMGVKYEKIRDPYYLAIYIAALKVLTVDRYPLDTLILRDSEKGPFKYLKDAQWHPDKAMKLACSDKKYQNPLMKLRSDERKILENEFYYDLSLERCGWLE